MKWSSGEQDRIHSSTDLHEVLGDFFFFLNNNQAPSDKKLQSLIQNTYSNEIQLKRRSHKSGPGMVLHVSDLLFIATCSTIAIKEKARCGRDAVQSVNGRGDALFVIVKIVGVKV